jgi:hypothetical protein
VEDDTELSGYGDEALVEMVPGRSLLVPGYYL